MAVARHAESTIPRRRGAPARAAYARIVAGAVLAVLLCAGFVGQRVYLMNLTYRLEAETARVRQLAQENEYLQLEVARARSLDRIEALARGKLGMVPPTHRDVVLIPDRPAQPAGGLAAATVAGRQLERDRQEAGWLSSLVSWAHARWPGRAAEAGPAPGQ